MIWLCCCCWCWWVLQCNRSCPSWAEFGIVASPKLSFPPSPSLIAFFSALWQGTERSRGCGDGQIKEKAGRDRRAAVTVIERERERRLLGRQQRRIHRSKTVSRLAFHRLSSNAAAWLWNWTLYPVWTGWPRPYTFLSLYDDGKESDESERQELLCPQLLASLGMRSRKCLSLKWVKSN